MIKTFFGLSKVFQKPWNSFRILSSVSIKYSSMRKEKKQFCITKKPREICQHLTDFWIKKNDILRLFECFQLSGSTAWCQKRRCDRILALCIRLKKRISYPYRCKDLPPLFGRNFTSFDRLWKISILRNHNAREFLNSIQK